MLRGQRGDAGCLAIWLLRQMERSGLSRARGRGFCVGLPLIISHTQPGEKYDDNSPAGLLDLVVAGRRGSVAATANGRGPKRCGDRSSREAFCAAGVMVNDRYVFSPAAEGV